MERFRDHPDHRDLPRLTLPLLKKKFKFQLLVRTKLCRHLPKIPNCQAKLMINTNLHKIHMILGQLGKNLQPKFRSQPKHHRRKRKPLQRNRRSLSDQSIRWRQRFVGSLSTRSSTRTRVWRRSSTRPWRRASKRRRRKLRQSGAADRQQLTAPPPFIRPLPAS